MPFRPLKPSHKSLSRQVMDSIEKMIRDQKLLPGDILPTETQIADELQVSKSSVREAIKMLEAIGIVEIHRGVCTVISGNTEQGYLNVMLSQLYINSGSPEELQIFRRTIETAYTTLAIDTATDNDLNLIHQELSSYREKALLGQLDASDDIAFHNSILASTHNSFLISLGSALNEVFRETIGISIQTNPCIAVSDHERIYAAIVSRDKSAAIAAIEASAKQWAAAFQIKASNQ